MTDGDRAPPLGATTADVLALLRAAVADRRDAAPAPAPEHAGANTRRAAGEDVPAVRLKAGSTGPAGFRGRPHTGDREVSALPAEAATRAKGSAILTGAASEAGDLAMLSINDSTATLSGAAGDGADSSHARRQADLAAETLPQRQRDAGPARSSAARLEAEVAALRRKAAAEVAQKGRAAERGDLGRAPAEYGAAAAMGGAKAQKPPRNAPAGLELKSAGGGQPRRAGTKRAQPSLFEAAASAGAESRGSSPTSPQPATSLAASTRRTAVVSRGSGGDSSPPAAVAAPSAELRAALTPDAAARDEILSSGAVMAASAASYTAPAADVTTRRESVASGAVEAPASQRSAPMLDVAGGCVATTSSSSVRAPRERLPGAPTPDVAEGHRERLRGRFDRGEELADYELLELLLFRAIPRRDTKPIAKALVAAFGSFAAALSASSARLAEIDGIGERVASDFALVRAAAERFARQELAGRTVLGSTDAVVAFYRAKLRHAEREEFHVLFLDKKNQMQASERAGVGTVDHTPVYPREVVKRALELSASAVVLVHNHPSGDPTPSRADIAMTNRIIEATAPLGITVHDHLIIGANTYVSLRAEGHV